eukprot:94786_1
MGNHHSNAKRNKNRATTPCTPTERAVQLLQIKSSTSHSKDSFIINHHHKNKTNDSIQLDERRLVFVSLPGLYASWCRVPSILLYTSLLIMPLKRAWILQPSKYIPELQQSVCTPCSCSNIHEIADFIQMLQWKDSQGLLLFVSDGLDLDDYTTKLHRVVPNPLVAPFWYRVNAKLISLYDHVERSHYKPLRFDEKYWANRSTFHSKYKTQTKLILGELYFVTMRYNAMQEIIYQSNPKSLRPVIEYGHNHLEMQCSDPLSPIIEEEEHETRFCFKGLVGIDIDPIQIHLDGVTPTTVTPLPNEEMTTPSTSDC